MLKKTETEETIVFFVTFLSLVAFQLGGPGPPLWLRLCPGVRNFWKKTNNKCGKNSLPKLDKKSYKFLVETFFYFLVLSKFDKNMRQIFSQYLFSSAKIY